MFTVPRPDDRVLIERGFALYRGTCVPCHGAPGIAPDAFAPGLVPPPGNLAHTAREWLPAELYWVRSPWSALPGGAREADAGYCRDPELP